MPSQVIGSADGRGPKDVVVFPLIVQEKENGRRLSAHGSRLTAGGFLSDIGRRVPCWIVQDSLHACGWPMTKASKMSSSVISVD